MTNSSEDNASHDAIFRVREQPDRVRATSTRSRHSAAFDRPQTTVTTAEIPVIRSDRSSFSSARNVGSRTGSRPQAWTARPDPAPAPLRLLVWTFLFVLILVLVGFITEIAHPTWLSFLRNVVATPHALALLHGTSASFIVH